MTLPTFPFSCVGTTADCHVTDGTLCVRIDALRRLLDDTATAAGSVTCGIGDTATDPGDTDCGVTLFIVDTSTASLGACDGDGNDVLPPPQETSAATIIAAKKKSAKMGTRGARCRKGRATIGSCSRASEK